MGLRRSMTEQQATGINLSLPLEEAQSVKAHNFKTVHIILYGVLQNPIKQASTMLAFSFFFFVFSLCWVRVLSQCDDNSDLDIELAIKEWGDAFNCYEFTLVIDTKDYIMGPFEVKVRNDEAISDSTDVPSMQYLFAKIESECFSGCPEDNGDAPKCLVDYGADGLYVVSLLYSAFMA